MPKPLPWYKQWEARRDYSAPSPEVVAELDSLFVETETPPARKVHHDSGEEMQDYFDRRAEDMFGEERI